MPACSVKGCKNRSENAKKNKISLFSFPKVENIASKWVKACGKNVVNLKYARICSIHFTPKCYKEIPEHLKCLDLSKGSRSLLPNAVPTENLIFEEARGDLREVNVCIKNAEYTADMDNLKNSSLNVMDKRPLCTGNKILTSTPLKTTINSNISKDNAENNISENVSVEILNDQNYKSMNVLTSFNNIINENFSLSHKNDIVVTKDCENLFTSVSNNNEITLSNVERSFNMTGCSESQSIVQNHHENVSTTEEDITSINIGLDQSTSTENYLDQLKKANSELAKNKEINALTKEQLKEANSQLAKKNKKINALKTKLKRLEKQTKIVTKKKVNEVLKNIFTPKQIEKIMNPNKKRINWNIEDIAPAISLRSVSPKAYRYLKENKYPLPGLSTLRKWATRLNLDEGILKDVFLRKEKN